MRQNWGLVGHIWAVELLRERLEGSRLGHAILIMGPKGVGKMTLARRLAQAVNCTGDVAPCGECRACTLLARDAHPDLHLLEPDGAAIKIEAVRDLMTMLAMRPLEARFRVALIPDAERLTDAAADALLKTLEEPSPTSKLILTTQDTSDLLPTIVSRCQLVPLRPVPTGVIEGALVDGFGVAPDDATIYAGLSGGRPGWALRAANGSEVMERRATMIGVLIDALNGNRSHRFEVAENLRRMDREELNEMLEMWLTWWRDVLLLSEGSSVQPLNVDQLDDLSHLAEQAGSDGAREAITAIYETLRMLGRNANRRLALEVMFLKMPFL